ncbi:hypothetical protein GCM10027290_38590 [Micromonospora sonneratiae]|uniref:Globin n=1 Tax=Micromonospora sonneratiae TaxID=1184706 RepID=A0ABW3Y9C0_9ACTN
MIAVEGGLPPADGQGRAMSGGGAYPAGASVFDRIGPRGVGDVVARWLRLVAADTELSPYLIGVDLPRLGGHLALQLTVALGGPVGDIACSTVGVWHGFGLSESQHRRVVAYLTGTLQTIGVPQEVAEQAGRAFTGKADS